MTKHKLARQTVKVNPIMEHANLVKDAKYHVEDLWINVAGKSWMDCDGNPACLNYAARSVGLPIDDKVLYGKIGGLGYLVHESEIVEEETT